MALVPVSMVRVGVLVPVSLGLVVLVPVSMVRVGVLAPQASLEAISS